MPNNKDPWLVPSGFSNPQVNAEFSDWPAGKETTTVRFSVLKSRQNRSERVVRYSPGRNRRSPFGRVVRLVRGSDGKHYVVGLSDNGNRSFIMPGSMRRLYHPVPNSKTDKAIRKVLSK